MKKCLEIFISIVLMGSFIMTGCVKEKSVEEQADIIADSYLLIAEGRVMEIVGKNTVLVNVLKKNRDFQVGDTLAIKYSVSKESSLGLDNLEDFEAKPMEVQVGDIIAVMYSKAEKRDIGEIKDCNYINTWHDLDIIPEERYESMYSGDAD